MSAFLRFSLLILAAPLLALAEPKLVRVWPEFKTEEAFGRIGEYFGEAEHYSDRIIERSQAKERTGYYFLVRIDAPANAPTGATWQVQVILPNSEKPVTFSFPFDPKSPKAVYELGITGKDWPNAKTRPVAWRLSLLTQDGKPLASEQSFLWR